MKTPPQPKAPRARVNEFSAIELACEVWRSVDSLKGISASSLGRIRRDHADGRIKVLSQHETGKGYLCVSTRFAGKSSNSLVHRLVCEAFNGPCPVGKECAHGDGIRTNNRSSNLSWKTPAENYADRDRHGTTASGIRNGASKLDESGVLWAIKAYEAGVYQRVIAARLGVDQKSISSVLRGETWSQVTGIKRREFARRVFASANLVEKE